ncbi:hypothetical protein R6Q59_032968 [Mikania micrantha]
MVVLQLHSFRSRNTSTNFTHVVITGASPSASSVSSHQSVSTPKSNYFDRLFSKFTSNSLNFALSGTLALAITLSGVGLAEAKVGVNKPELLPKEFTTVIDVAGFLSDGQEKRLVKEIDSIEKDTGFKLRVLAQNYPDTPGLATKDFWQVDDRTIVFVANPTFGNILNFNVGETVDLDISRSFWSRLAGKYGNMFYPKEKGEDASVEAAVMAISYCLREPVGANNCAEIPSVYHVISSFGIKAEGSISTWKPRESIGIDRIEELRESIEIYRIEELRESVEEIIIAFQNQEIT